MKNNTHNKDSEVSKYNNEKQDTDRGNWDGQLDFLMSCISYAVGLGNIWRFPYLCYRNGGAVFLVPYIIFLFLCTMPLFFLEISYGQFASLTPITIWRISPIFKGIGFAMVTISAISCIYYIVIITWAMFFLFKSFSSVLPWSTCGNWWNTPNCVTQYGHDLNHTLHSNLSADCSDNIYNQYTNFTYQMESNFSLGLDVDNLNGTVKRTSSSEEYWERYVLQISSGIEEMGSIRWELLGCLVFAWVVVFFCLMKGVKSSGKVYYVTAIFPYIILGILFIRGVTLPGAKDGIKFYLIPKWEKLLSLKVWGEAAMQIFYSMGTCWGALITLGSYNKFHHNCYRDAKVLPLLNSCTSVFAGFVIFSVIGFMAHETGSDIHNVITQGPGLVFVVYPEAVSRLPISQLWSILFFSMVIFIGLGSQISTFQTVIFAWFDEFPVLRKKSVLITAIFCLVEFLLGIPCVMNGGIYFLQILDWYTASFALMVIGLSECIVIAWVYGIDRYYNDLELMLGMKPAIWWKLVWCYFTPALSLFIISFNIISHTPVTYGDYSYPIGALVFGWASALVSMIQLPIVAIVKVMQAKGTLLQRIKSQMKPSPKWGPALPEHRALYILSLKDQGGHVIPDLSETEEFMSNNTKEHTSV